MEFKKVTIEDKDLIDGYLRQADYPNCELTFTNILLWSRHYPTEYAIVEGCLVIHSLRENSFTYPMGKEDPVPALEALMAYCREQHIPFRLHSVNETIWEKIKRDFPGKFQITWNRDSADYIYNRSDLAELKGKKYHGKRNHINNFLRTREWSYEPITDDNREECFEMSARWWELNGDDQGDKETEMTVTRMALNLMEYLGLVGGLIRVDGRVAAFSIGEPVNHDTFVVHIEKAFAEIQGAYPVINQQFVLHEAMEYTYINREDDTGAPGLRKAKLSYHPAFLLKKGYVIEKTDTRALYEEVFPQDSKEFVDYYYSHKAPDNKILTRTEEGQAVSMLHMNPYTLWINGAPRECYYLVAVATRENCRRRGYMRELMEQAFQVARTEDVPYLYLMPTDPAIYEDFGFQFITPSERPKLCTSVERWNRWKKQNGEALFIEEENKKELTEELLTALTEYAVCQLSRDYDIYTRPSGEYYRDLFAQAVSEHGGLCILYKENENNQEITGFCFYCRGEQIEFLEGAGELPFTPSGTLPGIMAKDVLGQGMDELLNRSVHINELV